MCQIHVYQHPCGHEIRSGLSWVCRTAITASLGQAADDPIPECNTIEWIRDTNIPAHAVCRVCTEGLTLEEASRSIGGVATPDAREAENGNGISSGGSSAPAPTSSSARQQTRGGLVRGSHGSGRGSRGSGRGSHGSGANPGQGQNMPNGTSSGSGEDDHNGTNRRT